MVGEGLPSNWSLLDPPEDFGGGASIPSRKVPLKLLAPGRFQSNRSTLMVSFWFSPSLSLSYPIPLFSVSLHQSVHLEAKRKLNFGGSNKARWKEHELWSQPTMNLQPTVPLTGSVS